MNSRIYLSPPHMGGEEIDYIQEAFATNWIAPLGANVDGFEDDLQRYIGGGVYAAAVTSGTAAIHLSLMLCGVEAGDEVICQSFTFAASANPIRYLGATPVFVDSERETWNMDPELLEKAITDRMQGNAGKKPKAIILVYLYGMPAKIDQILQIADKYDIPVIEDAAEALGSEINGRMCGSFGTLSVLSFNGNKIITTSGGGALLSANKDYIAKARFLATQARDDAPHYQHSELGYNYRMSNIVAGVGRGQMKVLDDRIRARRANYDYYFRELNGTWADQNLFQSNGELSFDSKKSSSGFYFLREPEGFLSNRWLTTMLVIPEQTGGVTREDIRRALEEENIECRPLWKPMHLQPLYREFPYYGRGISDMLFKYGLCLPSGSNLTGKARSRVINVIKKLLKDRNHLPEIHPDKGVDRFNE